jgi:hypothetical protein
MWDNYRACNGEAGSTNSYHCILKIKHYWENWDWYSSCRDNGRLQPAQKEASQKNQRELKKTSFYFLQIFKMNELSYPESRIFPSVHLHHPATHTALKQMQCPDGSSDVWQLQAMTQHCDQAVQSQGKPTLEYPEINLVFPVTKHFLFKILICQMLWLKSISCHPLIGSKNFRRSYICLSYLHTVQARGGTVGWGTALQAGRSRVRFPMVSLEFFIDIILLASLWPWGWLSP